ncbi:hypothetical protein KO465_01765 [Candidatus Micrarchaeota archaeon]|nr:hypothetical protein [Candidatus Micrarchaeota archaeon]
MEKKTIFIILFILVSFVYPANTIEVIAPMETTVSEGDMLYLGTIGPGQTIYVDFDPKVDGGRAWWDFAKVTGLPEGWNARESKLYEDPLHVRITTSKHAQEGDYTFKITIEDEGDVSELGTITITCKVTIKHDIMDMEVTPTKKSVGAGQPARFDITIKNLGNTEDEFVVRSEGIKEWAFRKNVYIPAQSEKTIVYEIVRYEEENSEVKIIAESYNSPEIIKEETTVFVEFKPDLISDMKATNNGLILFPIINTPMHALLGLFSNLFQ